MIGWKKILIYFLMVGLVFSNYAVSTVSAKGTQLKTDKPILIDKKKAFNNSAETELIEKRTPYSKTFLKTDGKKRIETSLAPIHYEVTENNNKIFKEIDSSLTLATEMSASGAKLYHNKSNSFDLSISENIITDGVTIGKNDNKIFLKPNKVFASPVNLRLDVYNLVPAMVKQFAKNRAVEESGKTVVTRNEAKLYDAGTAVEYKYKSTNSGLKEEILLHKNIGKNTFSFDLNLEGYTYKNFEGVYYFYKNESKTPDFYMPPSFAYDSSANSQLAGNDAFTNNVRNEIVKLGNKFVVNVTIDRNWLADARRKFPVTIDPTINQYLNGGKNEDTYVQEKSPNTLAYNQTFLYTGYTAFSSGGYYYNKGRTRSLLPFEAPDSLSSHVKIDNARVNVYQGFNQGNHGILGRMTSDYDGRNITWNNQPTYSGETVYNQNGCQNCWIDVDVTGLAKYWYENNVSNFKHGYIAFWDDTDGDGTTDVHYRQWKGNNSGTSPRLIVDYTDFYADYSYNNIHDAKVFDSYSFGVNVHNAGSNWLHSWDSKVEVLAYRDGQPYARLEQALPYDVAPGGWATINFDNLSFNDPGSYTFVSDLYNNNYGWYSLYGIPEARANFTIIDYPEYAAEYRIMSAPATAVAGSTINAPLNVINNSRQAYTVNNFKMSYHWKDAITGNYVIWDGQQTSLPKDIGPRGDWAAVNLQVKTPFNSGQYKLEIEMVQPGVTWLSQRGVAVVTKDIEITSPSFTALTHFGEEDSYAKVGPVDLATGALAFSSTDMEINSTTGLLSFDRSFNNNRTTKTFSPDVNGYIQNWTINGPYREDDQSTRFSKKFVNEETIRPNPNSNSNGKLWSEYNSNAAILDINDALDKQNIIQNGYGTNSVTYAHTYVYSPSQQNANLRVGSDDGIKAWVNGDLVMANDISRGIIIDSDVVNVTLKAGWNRMLFKVSQGVGGWSLSARLTDSNANPIPALKYANYDQDFFADYSIFGKNWNSSLGEAVYSADPENVYYRDPTGSVFQYIRTSDYKYITPNGATAVLDVNWIYGTYFLVSKSGLATTFNEKGKVSSKYDLYMNFIAYDYDTNGNCIKIRDGNRYIKLSYDGKSLSTISDPLGNKVTYLFDKTKNPPQLSDVIDPRGNKFSYTYNADFKIRDFIDKNKNTLSIGYHPDRFMGADKVWYLEDAKYNATRFSYDDNKVSISNARNKTSIAEFDKNNLLIALTNAKNYREFYQYDGKYNLITITPDIPENEYYYYRYTYTYDSYSNLLSETDPLGKKTSYFYSPKTDIFNGNDLIKVVSPDNEVWEYEYTFERQIAKATDPKKNITKYEYDTKGNKTSVTDPKSNITKYSYSPDGDVLTSTSPKNEITKFEYDAIGRNTIITSPLGKQIKYTYSPVSQILKTIDSTGNTITTEYDANGNKTKEINSDSSFKLYEYNKINELIKITDESGAAIQYEYNETGDLIKATDANGKITKYEYDELGRLIKETGPEGTSSSVQYDRNNQPTEIIDNKNQSEKYIFNKDGGVKSITDPEGSIDIAYNPDKSIDRISSTVDGEAIKYTYDANNNTTVINSNINGVVNTTYDGNNSPTNISTSTANLDMHYDANGNVQSIDSNINSQVLTASFVRDADGKVTTVTKPNGDKTTVGYDNSGRVSMLSNQNKNNATYSRYSYLYDKASNIISTTESRTKTTNSYAYDIRNQLIREDRTSYTYDPMGNRLSKIDSSGTVSYQYDPLDSNRLIKISYSTGRTIALSYDENGSVIKKVDAYYGTTQYFYDMDNYFTKAILPNGDTVEYVYDKINKLRTYRIEKNASGQIKSKVKFLYEGDRLISELDDSGKVLKTYTWDENERLISVTMPDDTGTLQTFTYVKNLKEDIVGLSDQAGNLMAEYQYDAWGNIVKRSTAASSKIKNLDKVNTRQYSSYWNDEALGLYFMKTRLYDSSIGRFLSKDQIAPGSTPLSFNPYLYCNNNPVGFVDPSGKFAYAIALGFGGGAFESIGATCAVLCGPVAWALVGVAAVAAGVIAYNAYKSNTATQASSKSVSSSGTKSTSISGTTSAGAPAPSGDGDHNQGKNKKKSSGKSSQSKAQAQPKSTNVDKIESAKTESPKDYKYKFNQERFEHTLRRHAPGSSGSGSKFPSSWTAQDIEIGATLVANKLVQIFGEGPNKNGLDGIIREGIVNGVKIRVPIIGDIIWTAIPVNKFIYIK